MYMDQGNLKPVNKKKMFSMLFLLLLEKLTHNHFHLQRMSLTKYTLLKTMLTKTHDAEIPFVVEVDLNYPNTMKQNQMFLLFV